MHRYEELELWQRGVALAAALHRASRTSRPTWSDRAMWEQITRAATSIPANVAEGALRGSDREFARFLAIAMGSAAELHSLLHLGGLSGLLPKGAAEDLAGEAVSLRRMAGALRARANGLKLRGAGSRPQRRPPTEPAE